MRLWVAFCLYCRAPPELDEMRTQNRPYGGGGGATVVVVPRLARGSRSRSGGARGRRRPTHGTEAGRGPVRGETSHLADEQTKMRNAHGGVRREPLNPPADRQQAGLAGAPVSRRTRGSCVWASCDEQVPNIASRRSGEEAKVRRNWPAASGGLADHERPLIASVFPAVWMVCCLFRSMVGKMRNSKGPARHE